MFHFYFQVVFIQTSVEYGFEIPYKVDLLKATLLAVASNPGKRFFNSNRLCSVCKILGKIIRKKLSASLQFDITSYTARALKPNFFKKILASLLNYLPWK
jgi:hypothetical protein